MRNSYCVTVTLRQKKEKHILTRGQEHFNAICMPTIAGNLMMHPHHCEEVKQVTALREA